MEHRAINLLPFNGHLDKPQIILNILVFIPLGIYLEILVTKWSFLQKSFYFFLISLVIESLQYLLAIGTFDINDIITNGLGGIIGVLFFIALEKILKNRTLAYKIINIVAIIVTSIVVIALILLKMDLFIIKYR